MAGCSQDFSANERPFPEHKRPQVQLSLSEKQMIETSNSFSFSFFQETVKQAGDQNVFLSPLSASMALTMAYNGSAGATETAMRTTLGYASLTREQINEASKKLIDVLTTLDPKVTLKIANSLWYHNTFPVAGDFIERNQSYFYARVAALDFRSPSAPEAINAWCDQNTNGKIKNIIDKLQPNDIMALLNALYFKGTWTYQFDKSQTVDDLFTTIAGAKQACKMMYQENKFDYFETDDLQAVDLPYGNTAFSMTIFLPKTNHAVKEITNRLTPAQWSVWKNQFYTSNGKVLLPRIKLEYEQSLNDILSAMGMGVAFVPGQADFTGISTAAPIYISLVKQKTFLQVDEEGTEAAAVTVVTFGVTSVGPSTGFFMRIDRPFVFMIRDHATDTILFIGQINSL
jgi:serine protease inhibitor